MIPSNTFEVFPIEIIVELGEWILSNSGDISIGRSSLNHHFIYAKVLFLQNVT